ncbi:EamA family transporter [Altericroceibacterium xinjiangense]|uniref:EamA family transporter n=1 Tax=Altericroceibacterium xinjiangense TaxID=762261 RepID=UPI0019CF8150|nr:EamA family transporter [Altericroceibacterium xinjiangense]
MPDRTVALAGLSILLAQFSLNIGAALGKGIFPQVGPEGIAALRTTIAALILLPIARPWRAMPDMRQLRVLLAYGLAVGGMNLLIYWAFERIPIGVAVAIEVTGPLAVVLATSRSVRDFLWFGLAVAGLMLLVPWPGHISTLDPLGIAFALAAAACWALYILIGKHASKVRGSTAVAIGMAAACLVTVPFGVATAGAGLLQGPVLATGLAVAVLSSALPYMLEMKALGKLPYRLFGVATSAAPAIAALCGFLVLGEQLTALQWIAVALMIGASAGCSLSARPPIKERKEEAFV